MCYSYKSYHLYQYFRIMILIIRLSLLLCLVPVVRWFRGRVLQQVLWADCEVSKIKTTVSFLARGQCGNNTAHNWDETWTKQNTSNEDGVTWNRHITTASGWVRSGPQWDRLETHAGVCVWFSTEESAAANIKVSLFSSSPPPSPAPSLCGGGCFFFRSRPAHLFYRKRVEGLWRRVSVLDDCTLSLSAVSAGEGEMLVSLK